MVAQQKTSAGQALGKKAGGKRGRGNPCVRHRQRPEWHGHRLCSAEEPHQGQRVSSAVNSRRARSPCHPNGGMLRIEIQTSERSMSAQPEMGGRLHLRRTARLHSSGSLVGERVPCWRVLRPPSHSCMGNCVSHRWMDEGILGLNRTTDSSNHLPSQPMPSCSTLPACSSTPTIRQGLSSSATARASNATRFVSLCATPPGHRV